MTQIRKPGGHDKTAADWYSFSVSQMAWLSRFIDYKLK